MIKMKLIILVGLFVGGCLCSEQTQRDTTSVCVEMQGRMASGSQGRDDRARQGMIPPPYQQQFQQQYPPGHTQGIPPQGIPPQGMPPQGMPPQGMPAQGIPPQGIPPQGMPSRGMPPQGMPPQGMPPQGMPPQGMPPQGMPPHGMPPHGMPPRGMHPPGMPPPGMFMPPPYGGRSMPPMPPQIDPGALAAIKRLEEECAAKDHQIAELKAIISQHKLHPEQEFQPQGLSSPQHRQPEN